MSKNKDDRFGSFDFVLVESHLRTPREDIHVQHRVTALFVQEGYGLTTVGAKQGEEKDMFGLKQQPCGKTEDTK